MELYVKQSKKLLFRTLNCCESQIIPYQNAEDISRDLLLKAVTGLAGGLYNRGSTCGVVFGAAINLAQKRLGDDWSPAVERELLMQAGRYVDWFTGEFGGTLCRDRTGLDFQTIKGKVGLLIPKKAKGCVKQSALSMKFLLDQEEEEEIKHSDDPYAHCGTDVLVAIREKTGIGDADIERITTVLDGGIGLKGGSCAALAGGVIALGLTHGNKHSKEDAFRFRHIFKGVSRKFSKLTNSLIDDFEKRYGSLECSGITNCTFNSFDEFQETRARCSPIVEWVTQQVELRLVDST